MRSERALLVGAGRVNCRRLALRGLNRMEIAQELGLRVRGYRGELDFSRERLVRESGLSLSMIRALEAQSSDKLPSLEALYLLALALQVQPGDLLLEIDHEDREVAIGARY